MKEAKKIMQDEGIVLRGINLPEFHAKPKRRNGRLKWKQRALDAEAELEDAAIWRWIWVSLGVVVGSVGTPIVFYLLTGQ